MFRHQGRSRTFKHNLQIAMVLSFVAGIVNVVGFLSIQQLTTNVTGHFALFIYDVSNFYFWKGTVYLLYILSFLLGSFCSSFLIEKYRSTKRLNVFVIPTLIESFILISVALFTYFHVIKSPDFIACLLLFSMGLQNSFVSKISNAVVRTTHLTGLITDLGIELSQLFFPETHSNRKKIIATIRLRSYIICFFFFGGLVGGFLYSRMGFQLNALIFAAIVLVISLVFDDIKYQLIKRRRKHKQIH
jgi:uncharacterized membrane protein YoaK (UPF0700 family)